MIREEALLGKFPEPAVAGQQWHPRARASAAIGINRAPPADLGKQRIGS